MLKFHNNLDAIYVNIIKYLRKIFCYSNYEAIEQSSQQHSIVIESTINPNDTLWDVNSMENSIDSMNTFTKQFYSLN